MILGTAAAKTQQPTVRFMTLDPGHFHAALVHKSMYPQVSPQIDTYAPEGFDLEQHLNRIEAFNTRPDNPTAWRVNVHTGPDVYERMIAERPGNVVVLAGKNRRKIDYILGSVENGLHVLADKPWIIRSEDFPRLEKALEMADSKGLVAYDIMTERFEVTTQVQRELVDDPAISGGVVEEGTVDDPGVYMESVHHIIKQVAGAPLRRPAWFFDIREQGEALADVGTHLVDLSLWTLFPEQPIDYRRDLEVVQARRWPTVLTREQFAGVTGESDFPPELHPWVDNGRLSLYANSAVDYRVRGIHTTIQVLWNLESKEHGDTHHAVYRGLKAAIEVRQGAEENWQPETYVIPNSPAVSAEVLAATTARVRALQNRWAGLRVEDRGSEIRIVIPDLYRTGHEAHFGEVARHILEHLEDRSSLPAWEKPNMLAKYYITTRGTELSQRTR